MLLRTRAAGAFWVRAVLDQSAFTYTNWDTNGQAYGVIRYGVADDALPDVDLQNNPAPLPDDALHLEPRKRPLAPGPYCSRGVEKHVVSARV